MRRTFKRGARGRGCELFIFIFLSRQKQELRIRFCFFNKYHVCKKKTTTTTSVNCGGGENVKDENCLLRNKKWKFMLWSLEGNCSLCVSQAAAAEKMLLERAIKRNIRIKSFVLLRLGRMERGGGRITRLDDLLSPVQLCKFHRYSNGLHRV